MAERALIDTNMFMNLPKSCGVLAMPGTLARFAYTSPPKTVRSEAAITPMPAEMTTAPKSSAASIDVSEGAGASSIDV